MTSQVLDTKTDSHLYLPEKLEKPDKLQPKDKSYILESEAKPLKSGSAASVPNPKVAVFFATLAKFRHCKYFTHAVR